MFKNPWFTLVIGLMVGLTLGYVFAERQSIPPGGAVRPEGGSSQFGALPEGHPPIGETDTRPEVHQFEQQIAEVRALLNQNPNDAGLMVSLGDAYFELARATSSNDHWLEAQGWYEKAVASGRVDDANVMTDLAVVYRNLQQNDRALEMLERAIATDPDHWQAWYNKVIILNFDLHRHDEARDAFLRLEEIAASDPQVPDLSGVRAEVMGE